jgi:hypothetical protein
MATYVETDDLNILIDPGVSLGPKRYKLPPHQIELDRRDLLWEDVKEHADLADVLIITHYHYDHHDPNEISLYEEKILYIKDPKKDINKSQYGRAAHFLNNIDERPKFVRIADGNEYKHGLTTIRFSKPVYHGTNSRLGYVVEVSISCKGEKIIHTSDVEGPSMEDQVRFIIEEDPRIVILDGPMTYMLGYRYSKESLERSIENMIRIIDETSVETIMPEHHFMRDLNYKERIKPVYEHADEKGVQIITAAEYIGREIEMLEARRKELYEYGKGD